MLQVNSFQQPRDILASTPLRAAPSCLQELFRKQPIERLSPGQSLFLEGDAAGHLFEVVGGCLRIFKIISDGRRVITGFLYPGDLVGVSLKNRYLYGAEAIGDTKIRRFARKAFDAEVASSPHLGPTVYAHICDEMAAAQDQMVLLSCKNAEERVCTFLLNQLRRCEHAGGGGVVDLPMTRLDIADYLGLTIETVSRTMTKLSNKGIVISSGRHSLRIVRYRTLVQLSGDEEYGGDEGGRIAYGDNRHH